MPKCIERAAAAPLSELGSNSAQRLETALGLVTRGFALLPLHGKEPAFKLLPKVKGSASWKPLAKRKATAEDVRAWFMHDPTINIGIITGKASGGLIVADFDRNPSKEWLLRHALPPTPRVNTPRGMHCYYYAEKPLRGCDFKYGEIKAEGGYVVAPLSIHPSGKIYEWAEFFSLAEIPLAPIPDWVTKNSKRARRKERCDSSAENQKARGQIQPVAIPAALVTKCPLTSDDLRLWATDERAVLKMARVLGIEVPKIGESFHCVLPGHKDNRPSASLFRLSRGEIAYRDWHKLWPDEWLPLAAVRAAFANGEVRRLSEGEFAVWQTRLLIEAGLIAPALVTLAPLPGGESQTVKKVYEGFRFLLGCKWLRDPNSPTAFAYRFAAAWCGVGINQAGAAIKRLLDLQIIRKMKASPKDGVNVLYAPNC